MLKAIRMPQMGVSDESAILSKWLVREGDSVRKGQPVFSLETDKATFQYEAESDGILVRILTGEGEEASVGSPVGIMSDMMDTIRESELDAILKELNVAKEDTQVHVKEKKDEARPENSEFTNEYSAVQDMRSSARRVSPRARRSADEQGVNLNIIRSGSGPAGRIIERDVLNAAHTAFRGDSIQKPKGIYSGRPLTQGDRVNVRRTADIRTEQTGFVSRLIDARDILSKCNAGDELTPGTVICCELAKLLVETHCLNARRHGDCIYEYNTVHLRLNAETSTGTLKPVIRCAEAYTPDELAILMRNAADRCRLFISKPQDFQDGTFTVADLSQYEVDFFTPELTSPELCALGIGAIRIHIRTNKHGETEAYPAIRLTLVFDGAVIETVQAAQFLNKLAIRLEPGGTQQKNDIKLKQG